MKPPPLLLRFAHGSPWLALLAVILLAIWGLAAMHALQRRLADHLHRELVRSDNLDRQMGPALRRLNARWEIVQAVIDDRLPLPKAAGRFRDLDGERPPAAASPPGAASKEEEERYCREVITYVSDVLPTSAERAAVLERLERDLEKHLAVLDDRAKKRRSKMATSAGERSPLNSKQ